MSALVHKSLDLRFVADTMPTQIQCKANASAIGRSWTVQALAGVHSSAGVGSRGLGAKNLELILPEQHISPV